MDDGVGCGAEGHRRGDDFVARTNSENNHRQVQHSSAEEDADGVRGADIGGDLGADADPARAQNVHDFGDFLPADFRAAEY